MKQFIKDSSLAPQGRENIALAASHMPVVTTIGKRFAKELPFRGWTIACCLHITKETAVLVKTLALAGAKIALTASNPLSTQDDVAAALVKEGFLVFGWKGMDSKSYYECLNKALDSRPDITIDDGCDLVFTAHTKRQDVLENIKGGCEETTTGVIRLRAMEKDGALRYPIIAVNDALTKFLFDNRYGTGQSTIDGITRATNILWAGKRVVVAGYGWCGRGVATRARGMGALIIICEVDPIRALEAKLDGFDVMPISEASRLGEIFITVTGNKDVITTSHLKGMKNGAVLANSGHFDVEIDVAGLKKLAKGAKEVRPFLTRYSLPGGKNIYLIAEGRLANLGAAEGHPSEVMDMSFATQALSALYLRKNYQKLESKVYKTSTEQDQEIARLKLESMGIKIDSLSKEQKKYLGSWQEGTA